MNFSQNIINLLTLGFIVGLAFVAIAFIGTMDFASDFELITNSSYSEKIPLLVLFTTGVLGVYVSIVKVWKDLSSISHSIFLALYSCLLVVSVVFISVWLSNVHEIIQMEFDLINFPNDVDEITTNVRLSLIHSVSWMFVIFGAIGLSSFITILVHIKSLSRAE